MKLLITLLLACIALATATAPLYNMDAEKKVPDQYMVVFHKHVSVESRDAHVAALSFAEGEKLVNKFDVGSLIGYTAVLSKESLAQLLENPDVKYVEADQVVTFWEDTVTQDGATWGLDRIDQAKLPLANSYTYFESSGEGVTAYVIDSGVLLTHNEFQGRAKFGINTVSGEGDSDLNGHGTHVAGTIGGVTYGVAKKVTIVAVKVLSGAGSGTWAGVIAGVDFVTKDHVAHGKTARSVANMSLGGGVTVTLDTAVEESIKAGVVYSIAAGNSNANACNYSPARVSTAITVGATTSTDARSSYSNIGACVDIFAPGSLITSAWIGSNTATSTISGTSMAAPHVAGVIAIHFGHLLAEGTPDIPSPAEMELWITQSATPGVVTNPGNGSPNLLLFSQYAD